MDIEQIKLRKGRDFFVVHAPYGAFDGLIGSATTGQRVRSVILDLQRRDDELGALRVNDSAVRVISFPHAHRMLARILTLAPCGGSHESLEVLLPRRSFDQLADRLGAPRIKRLDLAVGLAADDTVLRHLGESLEEALSAREPATATIDQISEAVTVRLAQRYGGLQPVQPQRGGLTAWQLRLAWDFFARHIEGSAPLDGLARQCGLSASYFARAFRCSTGLAPHDWLVLRRVEVAKDMMLAEPLPLAQVAVACGFADQSHFTRTFAKQMGLPPARWRAIQTLAFESHENHEFSAVDAGAPA